MVSSSSCPHGPLVVSSSCVSSVDTRVCFSSCESPGVYYRCHLQSIIYLWTASAPPQGASSRAVTSGGKVSYLTGTCRPLKVNCTVYSLPANSLYPANPVHACCLRFLRCHLWYGPLLWKWDDACINYSKANSTCYLIYAYLRTFLKHGISILMSSSFYWTRPMSHGVRVASQIVLDVFSYLKPLKSQEDRVWKRTAPHDTATRCIASAELKK